MVGVVLHERRLDHLVHLRLPDDPQAAQLWSARGALLAENWSGQLVERAHELTRLEVDVFVAPFELIDLFEHRDRDDHVMFTEVFDAARIVKNNIGVEYEELAFVGHWESFPL